jgi:hypothetical protein
MVFSSAVKFSALAFAFAQDPTIPAVTPTIMTDGVNNNEKEEQAAAPIDEQKAELATVQTDGVVAQPKPIVVDEEDNKELTDEQKAELATVQTDGVVAQPKPIVEQERQAALETNPAAVKIEDPDDKETIKNELTEIFNEPDSDDTDNVNKELTDGDVCTPGTSSWKHDCNSCFCGSSAVAECKKKECDVNNGGEPAAAPPIAGTPKVDDVCTSDKDCGDDLQCGPTTLVPTTEIAAQPDVTENITIEDESERRLTEDEVQKKCQEKASTSSAAPGSGTSTNILSSSGTSTNILSTSTSSAAPVAETDHTLLIAGLSVGAVVLIGGGVGAYMFWPSSHAKKQKKQ